MGSKSQEYRPAAFDPARVELEPHVQVAIEQLARLNHDMWAWNRQREGWRYGKRRDDTRKRHPGLIPYAQLSEGEKQYDRNAATSTIRGLLSLGYSVMPPDGSAAAVSSGDSEALLSTTRTVIESADVSALVKLWHEHDPRAWIAAPDLYVSLGRRFIKRGEPILAYEVVVEGLSLWPDNLHLEHLLGLALARSGAVHRANTIAERLSHEVGDSALAEDVIALLGRTHKDLALAAIDPGERRDHLLRAFEAYRAAFERSGGYYAAINAATMAFLAGDRKDAGHFARVARKAAAAALARSRKKGAPDYWELATLGEAALVLGDEREAERRYREAIRHAGSEYGDIASMRRQLRLITGASGGSDPAWVGRAFRIPKVVVFVGQIVGDRALRATESALARTIRKRLRALDAGFGFSSAARGSDIIFLESIVAAGGKAYVVLPYPRDQFLTTRVAANGKGAWASRFEQALETAVEVVTASAGRFENDALLQEYSDLLLLGLARMQATMLETELVPLAVWNGSDTGSGVGATIRRWRAHGYEVELIAPAAPGKNGR
jgi:tetratricopeptide (TPR) repeat protein